MSRGYALVIPLFVNEILFGQFLGKEISGIKMQELPCLRYEFQTFLVLARYKILVHSLELEPAREIVCVLSITKRLMHPL